MVVHVLLELDLQKCIQRKILAGETVLSAFMHARTHARTHAHTHTHTLSHTLTGTCTHEYIYIDYTQFNLQPT